VTAGLGWPAGASGQPGSAPTGTSRPTFSAGLKLARASAVASWTSTPFRACAAAWLAESDRHADQLARLERPGAFQQRQADRRALLAAIDAVLLRRALIIARRR
jgi:hypothetical protein